MRLFVVPGWYMSPKSPQNGIFFKEQAQMLQHFGNEVLLIDCTERSRRDYFARDNFLIKKYEDEGLPVYQLCYPNLFLTKTPHLKRELAKHRFKKIYDIAVKENGEPDGVICHGFIMGNNVISSQVVKCPVIVIEHSSYVLNKKLTRFQVQMLTEDISKAKAFLCVSDALKKSVLEMTSFHEDRITVLPNPLNSIFDGYRNRKDINSFRFICVSTINAESKGIRTLIEAFCTAFPESDSVELVILGDGKDYSDMKKLIDSKGRRKQISMPGRVSREIVKEYLCQSDVFVLASKYETFGIAYIEALASGLPVITQSNGGSDQIITEENGILLAEGTVDTYSNAMRNIRRNINRYNKKAISSDCIARYSEKSYVTKVMNYFI